MTALHNNQRDVSDSQASPPGNDIEIIFYGYSFAEIINHSARKSCFIDETFMVEFESLHSRLQQSHPATWKQMLWDLYSARSKGKRPPSLLYRLFQRLTEQRFCRQQGEER